MTFTEQAKEQAQASWQGSFQHPFITELHEGTLSPTIFRYYLIQDHYYLKHFSQLYRLIAHNATTSIEKITLNKCGKSRVGELAIRETFFEELAITEEEVAATPIAPTAITMFLICIANLLKEHLRRPQQVCCLVLGSIKKLVHS